MTIADEAAALRAAAASLEAQAEPQPTADAAGTAALEMAPVAPLAHRFEAADLHARLRGGPIAVDEALHQLVDAIAELQAQHAPDGHA